MHKKLNMYYSKIYLRNKLRLHCTKTENEILQKNQQMSIIAENINNNKVYQINCISEGKTKEQLLALGFSVSQIHNYFEYKVCHENSSYMRWHLKTYLIINGRKIRTIKDLSDVLNINKMRHAS